MSYTRLEVHLEEGDIRNFEARIGHSFADRDVLLRAITHKSYSHESRAGSGHNETFEFLGDAVLGFVIGDVLFRRFPELDEGALSKMKAYLVSAPILARKAKELDMGNVLLLGVGEQRSGGRRKDSLQANMFEAVIAAIYIDGGIEAARSMLVNAFENDLKQIDARDLLFRDFKTALQEVAQGLGHPLPEYSVVDEKGPDHDKLFEVEVSFGDSNAFRGEGSSKKEAQQKAAEAALQDYYKRRDET